MDIRFILHDASNKLIIALPKNKHVGQFLQHNILDTRLTTTSISTWNEAMYKSNISGELYNGEDQIVYNGGFSWISNSLVLHDTSPTYNIKQNKAKFLSKGFDFVNSILDSQTLLVASDGYFINLDDIRLFPNIVDLAESLSLAYNISLESAEKQLIIEKESLLSIELYRKQSLWKHCKSLLLVTNETEYTQWKASVRITSGGLGLI